MAATLLRDADETPRFVVRHDQVPFHTRRRIEFVDLTELVVDRVRQSGVTDGNVNVQTLHTTTAIFVNENEPLLLEDLELLFERLAPRSRRWLHDDFDMRRGPLAPDERPNGDAHARAALLGCSETLNVVGGRVLLGKWQRVLLVELDGGQRRTVSLTISGLAAPAGGEDDLLSLPELNEIRSVS